MADTVSKLYAEIGFKVNQDGLKQAQRFLTSLHRQMSALNKQTKEVARQYGIFSANQNKQAMADERLATQREKTEVQRNKKRIDNKKFEHKQLMDLAKLEFQIEKQNAREQASIDAKKTREERRQHQEREKQNKLALTSLKNVWNTTKAIMKAGVGLMGSSWALGQAALKFTEPSRQNAMEFRNFGFETGMSYENFRKFFNQFASQGLGLSQKDVMGDMANIQRNLTQIALGGGNLDTYKLMDIREAARRNDLTGVLEGIRRGIQRNEIDNSMLTELVGRLGVSNPVQWAMAFKQGVSTDEDIRRSTISSGQQRGIVLAEIEVRKLSTVFENLRDQLTSAFAPSIRQSSEAFKGLLAQFAEFVKNGGLEPLIKAINTISSRFMKWLTSFSKEDVERFSNNLVEYSTKFVNVLGKLANFIKDILDMFGQGEVSSDAGRKAPRPGMFKIGWETGKGWLRGAKEGFSKGGIFNMLSYAQREATLSGLRQYAIPVSNNINKSITSPTASSAVSSYIDNSRIENTFNVSDESIADKAREGTETAYKNMQMYKQANYGHNANITIPASTYSAGQNVNGVAP